jgi:hypothetical protein
MSRRSLLRWIVLVTVTIFIVAGAVVAFFVESAERNPRPANSPVESVPSERRLSTEAQERARAEEEQAQRKAIEAEKRARAEIEQAQRQAIEAEKRASAEFEQAQRKTFEAGERARDRSGDLDHLRRALETEERARAAQREAVETEKRVSAEVEQAHRAAEAAERARADVKQAQRQETGAGAPDAGAPGTGAANRRARPGEEMHGRVVPNAAEDPQHGPPDQSPLDAALEKLVSGNIAFNTPDRIPLGKSRVIEAKLSTNVPPNVLLTQLSEAGAKESASIKVSDRMTATLIGGGAFDVLPSGPQQQFISKKEVTTWTWVVTPKQGGTQFLMLSFDAVLSVDGKDGMRTINTFKRKIQIDVPWPETPSEWFVLLKNWFENVSWFWLTILVPVGLWLWNKFRKKPAALADEV